MIGGVAGQGMPDITKKTTNIYTGTTASTTSVDVVNISGSGYLLGITQACSNTTTAGVVGLKIVVDGVTIIDEAVWSGNAGSSRYIELFKRFATSLQVAHKISTGGNSNTTVSVGLD